MDLAQIAFFAFAAVATVAAAGRHQRHATRCTRRCCLVLTFFSVACTWILAGAEFLGIALILVYVGAVMVLFLFVVMMLDIDVAPLREGFVRYLPIGLVVAVVMLVEMLTLIGVKARDARRRSPPTPRRRRHVQHRRGWRARCSPTSCCRSRSPR